ncbi:MAG: DNA gyrase inhibitor YacG [Bacteriovorax sp.]|nr:DNA gyrase inhibitor YacG [Bacteriovorax sp.]
MNKLLKVKCPQCDIIFSYYESEFRPFCTERCKMIDLGHWFKESYRFPVKEQVRVDQTNETNKNEEQEKDQDHDSENDEKQEENNFIDDYEDDENNY